MNSIQDGDFEEGVRQMNRVLAVRGQVVPATGAPVTLHARLLDGTEVTGQSEIGRSLKIDRVWLTPEEVTASEDARKAIDEADLIVIGPGSLYTSIMPSLLLPEMMSAVRRSKAIRLYVCNVATQRGETQGYDLSDHLEALERHAGSDWIDVVLANNRFKARRRGIGVAPVKLRWPPVTTDPTAAPPRLILDDVVDPDNSHHHDSAKLAVAIMRMYERETYERRRPRSVRTA